MKAAAATRRGSLFLIFKLGTERYALAATDIVEVLPRLYLAPVAQAPNWVAGILAHRGVLVPVLDLAMLAFGTPAVARTSTRLVLVHYTPVGLAVPQRPRLLGLILEHATDTLRLAPSAFQPSPLANRTARYLGPVLEDAAGLLQWIQVNDLLDPAVCDVLFEDAGEGGRA